MNAQTLHELLSAGDTAWTQVAQWLAAATRPVEVLDATPTEAERTLLMLQLSTHTPLGALAYHTGGVLIEHGWLRLLGSGHARMRGNLLSWNGQEPVGFHDATPGALIVALDALGGVFALNQGAFSGELQRIFYYAPDAFDWEDLTCTYPEFLRWTVTGDMDTFYSTFRWQGWEEEVKALNGDDGIMIYPPLFTGSNPLHLRAHTPMALPQLVSAQWHLAQEIARRRV